MTSKEIEQMAPTDISTNSWLKLMALQLSILIESLSAPPPPEIRPSERPRKH